MSRLHFITSRLSSEKKGVTARQLSEEWECSDDTIYRDIDLLRQMGVKIISQAEGHPITGYSISPTSHVCPFCGFRKNSSN